MLNISREMNAFAGELTPASKGVPSSDGPIAHVGTSNVIAFPQIQRDESMAHAPSAIPHHRLKPVVVVLDGDYSERQKTLLQTLKQWKRELAQAR